ncbi:uncharacterized protein LOC105928884 isoform X2 [Fundulus heteroclitus]|uniref:uncharacterized protein LOC105928884 isoform X2 n=1 Tax=Fundulus heteroclitus TaxID=8078 RepID=UPI00165B44E3|nr:uncharacterized protein LOC105928884 isoform X2 [Fundulus heteroclitus]
MDPNLHQHFEVNTLNFKRSLDRIAEKYSKLKDDDDVPDVDISIISTKSLSSQLTKSRRRIMKLGLMSQSDIEDQTLSSHVSDHSQLTWQSKDDDSSASSGECSKDYSEKTQESLDESGRELSESELLPEDQDEALQMSLSSQSGSLAELYPMMVSRIQRAWNRQTVSVGASSVLRRYRRWRQQPKGNLNKTFNITASAERPEPLTGKRPLQEGSGSPGRRMWPQMTAHPAPSTVAVLHDGEHQSPGRERGLLSGQTPRLISAPDLSGAAKPKERSFMETFFGCELSPRKQTQIGEQGAASPSRRPYAAAKWCVDPPLRFKRHSVSSHSAEASSCTAETASGPQSSRIYSSPVRQSPLKARKVSALCRSPLAFTVSPREPDWESSREPTYPRSLPVVVSSPPKRPVGLLKMMLHPQDSSQPPRPLPLSPLQTRAADNHRRPRRNLSFDSSSSRPVSLSPNKVDEDFEKLYHKFVCQSKPVDFSGLPSPRGRSSEARRVLLSTSLSALALSPHRSILRKRHCEDRCDGCPQPKLFRKENYPYSPGSARHMREMLKRSHSQSELEPSHGVGPCSPRRLRTMGALLSRHRLQFSSSGGAPENEAVYVYPPW